MSATYGVCRSRRGSNGNSEGDTNRSDALISEGDKAPTFSLQADDGTTVTLDSLMGKNVVLFFYPKDNTSG
jgi:cytochrome oxidase Cu insertion factor (SCO1/SenC/PrrC family)